MKAEYAGQQEDDPGRAALAVERHQGLSHGPLPAVLGDDELDRVADPMMGGDELEVEIAVADLESPSARRTAPARSWVIPVARADPGLSGRQRPDEAEDAQSRMSTPATREMEGRFLGSRRPWYRLASIIAEPDWNDKAVPNLNTPA